MILNRNSSCFLKKSLVENVNFDRSVLRFIQKNMKKRSFFGLLPLLFCCVALQAQSKKWTLQECVTYAIQNNISIKQSELDTKTATIDKKRCVWKFATLFEC